MEMVLQGLKIRYASLSDIDGVKKIADKNNDAKILGFVLRSTLVEQTKKRNLIIAEYDGSVVGFVNYNRRKKDNVTVVYEICTSEEFRCNGIATRLLKILPPPIELKCVKENTKGCNFYLRFGFKPIGIFKGKKNILNVYRYE